jgi:hypothetical protein
MVRLPCLPWVPLIVVLAGVAATPSNTEAASWWTDLGAEALADLKCADAEDLVGTLPAPWKVRHGTFKKHRASGGGAPQMDLAIDDMLGDMAPAPSKGKGGGGDVSLEALEGLEIHAGDAQWRHYAVAAEVKMIAGQEIALVAQTMQDVAGNGGYGIVVKGAADKTVVNVRCGAWRAGKPIATGTQDAAWKLFHLRPDLKSLAATPVPIYSMNGVPPEEQQAKYAELVRTEAYPDQDWDNHWLQLRIEVAPRQVRMWIDGTLVGSLDSPVAAGGGVALRLNARDQLRGLRVHAIPEQTEGYLPLDLAGKCNNDGLDGGDLGDGSSFAAALLPLSARYLAVDGIPFFWHAVAGRGNNIDMTQATVRGGGRFFSFNPMQGDRRRVMLRVPRRQYNAMALLVAADTRAAATSLLTVRMVKAVRCHFLDASGQIPDPAEAGATSGSFPATRLPAKGPTAANREQTLWLVRIPLDPGAFQDFLGDEREPFLDLDLMTPEGNKGLHIFAATLIEPPVEMKVTSDEIGHIFVEPQTPRFHCILRNFTTAPQSGRIEVATVDYYGATNHIQSAYTVPAASVVTNTIELPDAVRGLHYLDARMLDATGSPLVRRQTTYAILPPDTREADHDSPFGMWSFGDGHFGGGTNAGVVLMNKIGVRWSHHGDASRKVYRGYHNIVRNFDGDVETWLEGMQPERDYGHWSVFAEVAISGRHYNYFPTELLEEARPMALTADEESTFRRLWRTAVSTSETSRKYHPEKPLVFGNGYPQFIWTFLSRGYPRHLFDGLALDFVGDRLAMFYYLREVAKHYGYGEVPMYITEGFYVGSGTGYYPSRTREDRQSMSYLRGFLGGFANGMKAYIGSCGVWDNGGGYYYTGYGPLGVCHRAPEMNPKPSYCMYGTMSLLLDRAKFHSLVPTGSMCVYMTRFDGPRGPVYAVWTADGSTRRIRLTAEAGHTPRRTDSQCNSFPLTVQADGFEMEAGPTPLWIENAGVVPAVACSPAAYEQVPAAGARVIFSAAADTAAWSIDPAAYPMAEVLDQNRPVKATPFRWSLAEGRQDGEKSLALSPEDRPGTSPYRLRYAVLRPKAPIPMPAGVSHVGAWVYGNGAAIFDLEVQDAKGQTWTTLKGATGYSFGMAFQEETHQFEGWRYIEYPLLGARKRWRNPQEAGEMALPVKLTGLVLGQYGKVVYLNELRPPIEPAWRIGDVVCSGGLAPTAVDGEAEPEREPPAPAPQAEI